MSATRRKRKPAKRAKAKLVPQAHGGALLPGAGGGPQPGSGRPPDRVRAALRGALAERIKIATGIADNKRAANKDRLRALDFLAKYGLGPRNQKQRLEHSADASLEQILAKSWAPKAANA